MSATRAYIAGVGTTTILVASSVLMLLVVGAIVTFDGWPDTSGLRDKVDRVFVGEESPPVTLNGPQQVAVDAAPAAATVAAAPAPGTAAGLRDGGGVGARPGLRGSAPPTTEVENGSGRPLAGSDPGTPSRGSPATAPPAAGPGELPEVDTGTIRRNLSGTTREVTQELGKAVGQVDPNVGKVVSDTGQQLSNIVEGLPDAQSNQLLP